jgi:hypothetical protein
MVNFRAPLAAAAVLAASHASAQVTPAAAKTPPDDTPSVRVGGTIFTDFTYNDKPAITDADGNAVHQNQFNVGRAYINITGNLSHLVSFRITPDITRESGTGSSLAGSLTFRVKYVFGQLNLDDWLTHGSWIRLGAQQTPYIDFMEGVYRYRFQGQVFEEREGFMTSSDFGLSARYNFPGNYGEVHAGVYNGDGFTRAEPNDQKAFQVRGTLRPFPLGGVWKGLRLTAFYDADRYVKHGPRNRFIANATFEHKYANAGFDWLDAKDQTSAKNPKVNGRGWSVWATPKLKPLDESKSGFEALLRYDDLKPNKNVSAHKKRTIAGLSYWFPLLRGPSAAVLLDLEKVDYDSPLNRPDEQRISVHALLNF